MATSSRTRSTPQRPPCWGGGFPIKTPYSKANAVIRASFRRKKTASVGGLRWGWAPGPGWVRSCGPVRFQVDHFGPPCLLVQVIGPPLQQVGPVFQVGGSVVSRPHLIAFFVG